MRRVAAVACAATVAALSVAGGASPDSAERAACTEGKRTIGGVRVYTYCGPARGTLTFRGRRVTFRSGHCATTSAVFSISIGTHTFRPGQPRFPYLGLVVIAPRDGTFTGRGDWQQAGGNYDMHTAKITLRGGRTQGTFSAREYFTGAKVSGSFSC